MGTLGQRSFGRTRGTQWVLAVTLLATTLVGCGSEGEGGADELVGTWVTLDGVVSMEVTEDMMISTFEDVFVESTYTATDTTVEIVDVAGPIACPPDQPGVYEWAIADDVLSFTLVSDDCGRKGTMDGITFERAS